MTKTGVDQYRTRKCRDTNWLTICECWIDPFYNLCRSKRRRNNDNHLRESFLKRPDGIFYFQAFQKQSSEMFWEQTEWFEFRRVVINEWESSAFQHNSRSLQGWRCTSLHKSQDPDMVRNWNLHQRCPLTFAVWWSHNMSTRLKLIFMT